MLQLADAAPVSFVLTANRATAKPFYAGALGLRMLAEDDFAVTFALGSGATMRLTDLPDHKALGHTVLGWAVPDIGAAVAELRARGVTFKVYDGFGQDAENGGQQLVKVGNDLLVGHGEAAQAPLRIAGVAQRGGEFPAPSQRVGVPGREPLPPGIAQIGGRTVREADEGHAP